MSIKEIIKQTVKNVKMAIYDDIVEIILSGTVCKT